MKNFLKVTTLIRQNFSVTFSPIVSNQVKDSLKHNIAINQNILKAKTFQDLTTFISRDLQKMNIINICTTYRALLKYESRLQTDPNQRLFLKNLLERTQNMALNYPFSDYDSRSVSNLYFFYNKLTENKSSFSQIENFSEISERINSSLEEKIPKMIDKMNDQETANIIYILTLRNHPEKILKLTEKIIPRINSFSFKSNIMIFYSYASLDLQVVQLYKVLDEWFINNIKSQKMNSQDLSQLIFAYSKIVEIIPRSKIFEQLNKIHVFFYNEMNLLALSTIFHSLTRFEKPMISREFYEKYETKILENIDKMTDWMISNTLSGYRKWNYGSDAFYIKLEEKCIERADFLDDKSFSTILHSYASNLKGSFRFYEAFEKSLLKKIKKNEGNDISNKNLLFMLYSFTHIKDVYLCLNETRDFFKDIVVQRMDQFNLDELAPITAIYSTLIKENQNFFVKLKKILLEKNFQFEKIKNLAEISKSFALHSTSLFDKDLVEYFMLNLAKNLEKEAEIRKNLASLNDITYFCDLGKVLFSFLKFDGVEGYLEIYQKVARILEEICTLNKENAAILFQEPQILSFFKQCFLRLNIKNDFLLKFESV